MRKSAYILFVSEWWIPCVKMYALKKTDIYFLQNDIKKKNGFWISLTCVYTCWFLIFVINYNTTHMLRMYRRADIQLIFVHNLWFFDFVAWISLMYAFCIICTVDMLECFGRLYSQDFSEINRFIWSKKSQTWENQHISYLFRNDELHV